MLALNVHLAHADCALEAHERRARGRGHAVLARTGFGNNPLFAHPLGQQALTQGIVDLVRAQVVQILSLEPDLSSAQPFAEVRAMENRTRPARVMHKKIFQLPLKGGVLKGRIQGPAQLVQARLDGFRHILASICAEKTPAVGEAVTGGLAHALLLH